ncbi:MAG: hypothetical protein HRU19_10085 [Pseudobacteriovorax sp.]|nr:hypothetical protein [Pseudobacteriovorax sp.]
MNKFAGALIIALGFMNLTAYGGVDIAPYYSIKSTKSVTPGKKSTETEKIRQREEFGIKASVKFWRLMAFQFSLGQSNLTTTEKVSEVVDEYDEIDFATELDLDTSNPDKDIRIKETQNVGKLSFTLDPSFSIFILRFKLGITARQRIIEKSETGLEDVTITEGPTYKPHSGFGFGVKLTRKMYWMAEYEFYHYKYPPDIEPFERELSVSFGVSI